MSAHYPTKHPDAGDVVIDQWLDERGLRCPMPIVKLAKARSQYGDNTTVALIADDPGAEQDVPAWCRLKGAEFLGVKPPTDDQPGWAYVVRFP